MRNAPPGLYSIRGMMGCCHLLVDGSTAVMIDTGLFGEMFFIRRLVKKLGLQPQNVTAILLTHGHLDHAGNLAALKNWTGAKVYAHAAEQAHVDGKYPYRGITVWCDRLERAGRAVFRYRPAIIDEHLSDGQELPFWGGLRVIHLPGHTAGHCGFFSAKHDLLFSGDMFVSYAWFSHRPPAILNSVPEQFAASVARICQLKPRWLVPGHYDFLDGELHRKRFARLYRVDDWVHPHKKE